MHTDIFIKSYPKDYPWLEYALRSIRKFVTGYRQIILVIPTRTGINPDLLNDADIDVWLRPEMDPGYLWQQACKLMAPGFSDASLWLYHDSDCIYTKPFHPQDMLTADGRIRLLKTPYAVIERDYQKQGKFFPWRGPTQTVLNRPVEFEYMRRFPFLIPTNVIRGFRHHIRSLHGMYPEEYIMGQKSFSEFNALLAYADFEHRNSFEFQNTEELKELPPTVIRQFWSHAGIEAHRAEIEGILA